MSVQNMIEPKCSFADLVLPDNVMETVNAILVDHEFQDALLHNGLSVRKRILLHGPPGCGKTSVAHAFARALNIKLYAASTSETIGSCMGESEKGVDQLFKFAQQNRVVMLIDEFDSIATKRSEDAKSSSGKTENRIVNVILTGLESKEPLGLIVACTNLFDSLDPAILRRFDAIVEVPAPGRVALKKIANGIIQGRFGITAEEVVDQASTPSDVVRVALRLLREKVIEEERSRRARGTQEIFKELEELKVKLSKPKQPRELKEATT